MNPADTEAVVVTLAVLVEVADGDTLGDGDLLTDAVFVIVILLEVE